MCQLGELLEPKLLTDEPVIGYRGWYIKNASGGGKELFPLNKNLDIPFDKDVTKAILCPNSDNSHFLEHECGIYSYNNYYYNNYYYNNYNYNYNNYYNYNYNNYYNNNYNNYNNYYNYNYNNYYNNNYNNYYNYNNYNNYNYDYYSYDYYVAGKIQHSGKIAHHKLGYRSTHGKPILLVKLTPKENLNEKFKKFLESFNSTVQRVADYYECETIYYEDFK